MDEKTIEKMNKISFKRTFLIKVGDLTPVNVKMKVLNSEEPEVDMLLCYNSVYTEDNFRIGDKVEECFSFIENWICNQLKENEKFCIQYIGDLYVFVGITQEV